MSDPVLIAGATGFLGRALVPELQRRGHRVEALVRPASVPRVPPGVVVEVGDPLQSEALANRLTPRHTLVALVGEPHPAPWKKKRFETIDRVAGLAAVRAARQSGAAHLIYLSVAQLAPFMRAYARVRADVEAEIQKANLNATILRPWYILGPGRSWPTLLLPVYWILENQSATRDAMRRFGFVTVDEMVNAIARAIKEPPQGVRVWDVPAIRDAASGKPL